MSWLEEDEDAIKNIEEFCNRIKDNKSRQYKPFVILTSREIKECIKLNLIKEIDGKLFFGCCEVFEAKPLNINNKNTL